MKWYMYCFYFLLWVGRLRSNNNATIPFTFVCPTLWTNQTAEFFFERKYLFGIIFCTDLDIWGSNKIVKWFLSFWFVPFSPPNTLHCFDFLHWFGYLRRRWQNDRMMFMMLVCPFLSQPNCTIVQRAVHDNVVIF